MQTITPIIKAFFHSASFTLTYVVSCPNTKQCAIIDPALDFDLFSGKIDSVFAKDVVAYIEEQGLALQWILETHAHADHVTAASFIKRKLGGEIACGRKITDIQTTFKSLFNLHDFPCNGEQFDVLLDENSKLALGDLTINVLETPGHTPDSLTYVIGNNAFIGDTLFMPDSGSARCDFPDGSAKLLFSSIQKIYALGDSTVLHMCHDYQPNKRELKYTCTVAEQKEANIQISAKVSESDYVAARESRDSGLAVPRLIYPSLQLNIRAGELPEKEDNNQHYLKLPINGAENLS